MKKGKKKGKGGKVSGSDTSTFDISYNFELYPLDDNGEPIGGTNITSNEYDIPTYTFLGAIENFTGGYQINSSEVEAFEDGLIGIAGIWEYEQTEVFTPLALDLTARYISAGTDGTILTLLNEKTPLNLEDNNQDGKLNDEIIIESDRIEYILSSPELEERGIYEFTLFFEDEDSELDGFQLNGETLIPADVSISDTKYITDIETIVDILSLNNQGYRVSATSETGQFFSYEGSFSESTVLIEAENLITLGDDTYLEENFANIRTNDGTEPANDQGISLIDVEERIGTVSFEAGDYLNFDITTDPDGSFSYDLEISYFDENDGEAEIQVLINDEVVGEIILDEDTSSGFPTEDTRREYLIEDLDIDSTDTITIKGIADGNDWARIDNISFSQSNFTSEPPDPILIQAEDLNLSTYLEEDFSAIRTNDGTELANATGITLNKAAAKTGTATFINAIDPEFGTAQLSGVYDLEVSYFDENDGEAKLKVLINGEIAKDISGEAVGELVLDENTSSGFPTEDTRREYVFEDILIRPGDEIAIRGIADGSEWARVDFITFNVDTVIIFDETAEILDEVTEL